jgi:hypothetical protein
MANDKTYKYIGIALGAIAILCITYAIIGYCADVEN